MSEQQSYQEKKSTFEERIKTSGLRAMKANSTSSVFAQSTLTDPDVDELILSMSMVLQLHMIQDADAEPKERQEAFLIFDDTDFGNDAEAEQRRKQVPPLEYIYKFVKAVSDCAQFSAECNIIALVFVNRLIAFTGMSLHAGNWRSVLLTALLVAQKVWDDRCLVNGQFSLICPMFTVSKLNMLEKRFLEFLDYDVNISSRLYAKYYFELRALSEEQSNRAFALQPLSAKEARRLESRATLVSKGKTDKPDVDRRKSHDQFANKPKGVVIS
jgi:hypothetical protein